MSILTLSRRSWPSDTPATPTPVEKPDWPLMGDVTTIRAGVPEALIQWRRVRGETAPLPSDPDLRQKSL
ncbi:MAG: hypothetical protein ACU0GG_08665 [Paracoccaceae bacterium]